MQNKISTNTVENLTGIEIMHYALKWCYNWTETDFRECFKESRLGWDYFWDKLQGKCQGEDGTNPTQAIVEVILNMDNPHKEMLFNYLFNERYGKEINKQREDSVWMEEEVRKHKEKHGY